MKKITIHIIYISIIAVLIALTVIQNAEAKKLKTEVLENKEIASQNRKDALKTAAEALKSQADAQYAIKQAKEAKDKSEQLLKECKGK